MASVKGTNIVLTPCEHTMFVNVNLTLDGRCTGVVCSPDNYAYVDIAILFFHCRYYYQFITIIITTIIDFINIIVIMIFIFTPFTLLSGLPALYSTHIRHDMYMSFGEYLSTCIFILKFA